MKQEHNLVKHLDKSEAMGNVNNVCTNKTGTLIEGILTLVRLFLEGNDINFTQNKIEDPRLRDFIFNCV